MSSELEEYIEELSLNWFEVYKKSLSTYLLLNLLETHSLWSKPIRQKLEEISLSRLVMDDKSLYRALRRLEKQGLITHTTDIGQKTGLKRKIFCISDEGRLLLKNIRANYLIKLV